MAKKQMVKVDKMKLIHELNVRNMKAGDVCEAFGVSRNYLNVCMSDERVERHGGVFISKMFALMLQNQLHINLNDITVKDEKTVNEAVNDELASTMTKHEMYLLMCKAVQDVIGA